jgi:ATP-dependent 26S proteasome regulatory subunit
VRQKKNLNEIFDAAARQGAILFFDEADALFGKRTDVHDSHDHYADREINHFLKRLECYEGLIILAGNSTAGVRPRVLRFFDYRVRFRS